MSALATEAVAAARGLDLAVQHGYKNGILESDSLALIDGLKGSEKNWALTILPIINEIRSKSSLFLFLMDLLPSPRVVGLYGWGKFFLAGVGLA